MPGPERDVRLVSHCKAQMLTGYSWPPKQFDQHASVPLSAPAQLLLAGTQCAQQCGAVDCPRPHRRADARGQWATC